MDLHFLETILNLQMLMKYIDLKLNHIFLLYFDFLNKYELNQFFLNIIFQIDLFHLIEYLKYV